MVSHMLCCITPLHTSFCHYCIPDIVSLEIHNGKTEQDFVKLFIDDKTKQSSQEVLFDFIANSVAKFIKDRKIMKKLPLGFTFSFPVKQESLISGKLIRWTKDFKATGAEGEDVVQLLKAAFDRRGVSINSLDCSYFVRDALTPCYRMFKLMWLHWSMIQLGPSLLWGMRRQTAILG